MKTIMIIGAHANGSPLVTKAQELGYRTVACLDPGDYCSEKIDARYVFDLKDRSRLLEIAKREKIDGVVSQAGFLMETVAFVAKELGLVGNPEEAMRILGTKYAFRQLQRRLGLPAPKCAAPTSFWSFVRAALKMSFPLLVKPDFLAGAQGVCKVRSRWLMPFVYRAYRQACRRSFNGQACIEEFIPPPDRDIVECELCVYGGRYFFGGMYTSHKSKRYPLLGMSSSILRPTEANARGLEQLKRDVQRIFTELDVTSGEYNLEGFITRRGDFFIVEINPRQGGGMLPFISSAVTGIDYDRLLLTTAVGDYSYLNSIEPTDRVLRHLMFHRVYATVRGIYQGLDIPDGFPGKIIDCTETQLGSPVRPPRSQTEFVAGMVIEFPDEATEKAYAHRLEELIRPKISPQS